MRKRNAWRDDPVKVARYSLTRSLRAYEELGNPLFVWAAYTFARQLRVPLPPGVLTYLDRTAAALGRADSDKAIAGALGFGHRRGKPKAAREYRRQVEILKIVDLIDQHRNELDAIPVHNLFRIVAQVLRLRSPQAVKQMYYEAKRSVRG